MAKVTAKDRKKYSATKDGRFPIKNKAQAKSALRLRGHHTTPAQRKAIIRKAARYLPAQAKKAAQSDKKKK